MLSLDEALKDRRSVRKYLDKSVSDSDTASIVRAGCLAPSAKNRQPWRFVKLDDDQKKMIAVMMKKWAADNAEERGTVVESAKILERAPLALAVCTPAEKKYPSSDYISVGACLENMCLKATDLGLGSLIICDVWCVEKEARETVGTKDEITAVFIAGYGAEGVIPPRARKPLSKVLANVGEKAEPSPRYDKLPQADTGKNKFVFISYSHKDADLVISDIAELKHHGVALWYDVSIYYGENWDEKALGKIAEKNCVGLIVYVSKNSLCSKAVAEETATAVKEGKPVVPVHIGDMPLAAYGAESGSIPDFGDKTKYIARSAVASNVDATEEIVKACLRFGAVAKSGIYDDFEYELIEDGARITLYNGTSETVTVPSRICGKAVTEIGPNSFSGNVCIKKIILPETVKRVGGGAFSGVRNLKEINLPENINKLGQAAFRDCTSLECVSLPSGIKILEEAMFRGCISLKEAVVPFGVEELGEAVFNGCRSLKKAVIPDTVKKMTEGGFFGCGELENLTIPKDIKGLEKQSFETCPKVNVVAGGFVFRDGKADKP